MKVAEKIFYHKLGDIFKIYFIGDIHLGNMFCVEKNVLKIVKLIKNDPLAFWISMGDLGEYITPRDKRWDLGVIAPWLRPDNIASGQRQRINELLGPVKHKCLGMLWGNHERDIRKYNFSHIHHDICQDFKTINLGFSCFYNFVFRRGTQEQDIAGRKKRRSLPTFTILGAFTHGSGSATTDTSKLKKLLDFMDEHRANIYAYGHTHACKVETRIVLTLDHRRKIKALNKMGALTGCFFRTYEETEEASYGEQKNYRPTPIGCAVVKIDPSERNYRMETLI